MIRGFITKKAEPFNAPPKTLNRKLELKKKKHLGPNQIGPVEWEDTDEDGTQTMVTSLPATFVPAPGGYQGRVAGKQEKEPQKLTIGIDIDGVIADFQPVLMDLASEYVQIDEEDKRRYQVRDTEHGDKDLEHKVREEALTKGLVGSVPAMPGSVEKINGWYDSGHKIIILTAREEHWRPQTEEWLKKMGVKHHELILDDNKGPRAVKENIDIMIDDKPSNIEDLQKNGIKAYVFDRPWNQDVEAPRIQSWAKDYRGFTKLAPGRYVNFKPIEQRVVRFLEEQIAKLPANQQAPFTAVIHQFEQRTQPVDESEIMKFMGSVVDAQEKAAHKPSQESVGEEGFMIFPPGEGSEQERGEQMEPTEEYHGATGYVGEIQKLLDGLNAIPIAGWPQGYVGVEFDDEVLLINRLPLRISKETGRVGRGNAVFILPEEIDGMNWREYLQGYSRQEIRELIKEKSIEGTYMKRNNKRVLTLLENLQASYRGFTKFSASRWTLEDKKKIKDLYLKYRERGIPHHIIYKAAAELMGRSWRAIKQKLEAMYGLDEDLGAFKYEHWDQGKIDNTLQEL